MSKYSDFWFGNRKTSVDDILGYDTKTGEILDTKPKPKKDHVALAGHKRAIGNFVRIVSGKNIPVKFQSRGDSYTDGKNVTIGANINEKNFDHVVGLALHEGSHIAFSDFGAFADVRQTKSIRGYELDQEKMDFYRGVINYIEDRRVDDIVFKSSPGYKGYYHELYNKYFNAKKTANGLRSNMFRDLNLDSYMFRIINFTNEGTDFGSLPRLADIYRLIDYSNIGRLNFTDDSIELAKSVCSIVFSMIDKVKGNGEGNNENSENGENKDSEGSSDGGGEGTEVDTGDAEMNPEDGQPGDSGESDGEQLSDRQEKQIERMFENQKQFLDGKTKKTKLTKKDKAVVNALSNSNTEMVETGGGTIGKVKTVVVPSLTQELIASEAFPGFFRGLEDRYYDGKYSWGGGSAMVEAINNGFRLGAILGKKLKIRGEEKDLVYTRQNSGKINKRLISELGFGNDNVFSHVIKERYNKANLHISIDGSGSMHGKKFEKAITSAVAMCKAADMAGNVNVVVDIRYTHNENPVVLIVYNSKVDKLTKIKTLWKTLQTSGTTPESLCFEAIIKKFLGGVNGEDNYFINYSDGSPWFSTSNRGSYSGYDVYYAGNRAVIHAKKMVKIMKNNGIKIMSYFISDGHVNDSDRATFNSMYVKDASFIDPTNMMNVARSMNDKFLSK